MTDIVKRLLDPMNGKALLGIRQEAADEVERLHRNEKEAQQHIAAIAALWRVDTEKVERLTADLEAAARLREQIMREMREDNERLRTRYDSATDQAVRYAAEVERLTAEFKLILATAPWSDKDGHAECLNIARRALGSKP